ncbi:MAG: hypothetical protein COB30_001800 [Ectothiorhodospiraceae bacterium]|nr:hypothetical protein [Ectothiorhodospiraceae bacterium]
MNLHKNTTSILAALALLLSTPLALAGNDDSIKGIERLAIQTAMGEHVQTNTLNTNYVIFDNQKGHLKKLTLEKLHDGIVRKGDFFVSCADFRDSSGKLYDLDFLVAKQGDNYRVLQALVHAVEGNKRPYHLESL